MTEIILKDIPDNYFDVLTTNFFIGNPERKLNWLEKSDRQKKRDSKVQPTENGQEIIK